MLRQTAGLMLRKTRPRKVLITSKSVDRIAQPITKRGSSNRDSFSTILCIKSDILQVSHRGDA